MDKQEPLFSASEAGLEIKKHSSIAQMSNVATLQERKTMNALIWIAKDQLKRSPEQRSFSCDLGVLKRLTGMKDNDNNELKSALRALHALQFEFNVLHKEEGRQWKLLNFMAEVSINEEGRGKPTTINFEFPTSILEAVKNPTMFVKLDLVIVRGLESKHSIALYEVLKDYLNLGKFRFELSDFKRLMGVGIAQYSNFTMLKRRILDIAVAEINAKTDIEAGYELEKQGRQTIALRFWMRAKNTPKTLSNTNTAIREQLLHYGISTVQADELLQKHDLQYLQANIAIVKEQIHKGEVQNATAYMLKALQVDFRPQLNAHSLQVREAEEQVSLKALAEEQQRIILEQMKADYARNKKQAVIEFLAQSEAGLLADLEHDFLQGLNDLFKKYYQEKNLEHPLIQAQWYSFVAKAHLPSYYHSAEEYIAHQLALPA